ncbi:MAG TPA: PKD domain-containing protein [Candidatus Thermoplasmatota archaeon]|nr:PKD domain-containing protein [Candidatus Thermoplasmatota archaeon]
MTPTAPSPLGYGMSASAVSAQSAAGVKPDYGTFWIGPWTLGSGWGGPDAQMTAMKNAGVTPAIHHYYWGDDISKDCLENGCYSNLHKATKDQEGWQKLTDQLIAHLNSKMQGKPVLIFLETEFNKGSVATYEPLDGYLAEKAKQIKAGYPNAQVVMALGNWGQSSWGTWDRTAAASDYVGIQGMRGSTRQSATDYATLYEKTLEGTKVLKAKFGKPIVLQDIALSTYPEPDYLKRQADELKDFFSHTADLKAQGVKVLIYRSWVDTPTMNTANWYGEAERHWGLNWHGNATLKPGGKVWVDGVKADRAGSSTPTTTSPPPANRAPSAAFTSSVSRLTASFDGSGSSDPDGQALAYAWTFGDGASATGRTVSHMYSSPGTYTVKLTVSDGSLSASTSKTVSIVQPNRAPTAAFSASASQLTVSVDGSASSDPDGDALGHSWTFGDGTTASGRTATKTYAAAGTYTVTLTVNDGTLSSTATKSVTVAQSTSSSSPATSAPSSGTPYSASFTFGGGANEWWMETKVSASPAPAKVEVKVGSGAWTPLRKRDSTTWGEEMHVTKGTAVAFRATAPDGRTAATGQHGYLMGTGAMQATGTATASPTPTASATPTASPTPSSSPATSSASASSTAFKAYFTARAVGNDWWIEVASLGNEPIVKVEGKVGDGSWVTMPKTSWGAYATSVHAPNGSVVTFRATSSSGATGLSSPVVWA